MDHACILGIDVSSDTLDLWAESAAGSSHDKIIYTEQDLDLFLAKHPELTPEQTLVGMESTGDYQLKAAKYFLEKGFLVKILNPILTNRYTKTTIRGTKTDKTDAEIIAKLLKEGHGDLVTLSNLQNQDKELLRLSKTISKHSVALKLRLQATRRKGIAGTEAIEEKLTEIIKELDKLSKGVVKQVAKDRSEEEVLIDSIPGFAVTLSAITHHELGDINRFNNVKALVAFAGLDPRTKQSGKLLNSKGRITKRGSPYLREALFLAANVAKNFDSELKAYYEKKKTEGRSHTEICCMISRKLLARIYVVLKQHRPYEKR